jgi:hypothetical protein
LSATSAPKLSKVSAVQALVVGLRTLRGRGGDWVTRQVGQQQDGGEWVLAHVGSGRATITGAAGFPAPVAASGPAAILGARP